MTVGVHPGLTLHTITDAPTLLALGKFQELADSTVINRTPFARELAAWMTENASDRPFGMRGREFGLSDDAARRFRDGLAGVGVLLPDETAAFAKAGSLGMRSSSAVMVVTVARDDLKHRPVRRARVRGDGAPADDRRDVCRDARRYHRGGSAEHGAPGPVANLAPADGRVSSGEAVARCRRRAAALRSAARRGRDPRAMTSPRQLDLSLDQYLTIT